MWLDQSFLCRPLLLVSICIGDLLCVWKSSHLLFRERLAIHILDVFSCLVSLSTIRFGLQDPWLLDFNATHVLLGERLVLILVIILMLCNSRHREDISEWFLMILVTWLIRIDLLRNDKEFLLSQALWYVLAHSLILFTRERPIPGVTIHKLLDRHMPAVLSTLVCDYVSHSTPRVLDLIKTPRSGLNRIFTGSVFFEHGKTYQLSLISRIRPDSITLQVTESHVKCEGKFGTDTFLVLGFSNIPPFHYLFHPGRLQNDEITEVKLQLPFTLNAERSTRASSRVCEIIGDYEQLNRNLYRIRILQRQEDTWTWNLVVNSHVNLKSIHRDCSTRPLPIRSMRLDWDQEMEQGLVAVLYEESIRWARFCTKNVLQVIEELEWHVVKDLEAPWAIFSELLCPTHIINFGVDAQSGTLVVFSTPPCQTHRIIRTRFISLY